MSPRGFSPSDESRRGISFLVVQDEGRWFSFDIYYGRDDVTPRVDVYEFDLPGLENPAVFVRVGEILEIVEIIKDEEGVSFRTLKSTWGDENLFTHQDMVPEVFSIFSEKIYGTDSYKADNFLSHYWDEGRLEFVSGLGAEKLIFEEGRYEDAILMLKEDLQLIERYSLSDPKMLYLLGLAYELSGDSTMAVQSYYQLWNEHPESPYALLAKAKHSYELHPLSS